MPAIAEPKPAPTPAPPTPTPQPKPTPAPSPPDPKPEPVTAQADDDDPFKELDAKIFTKKPEPEPVKPADKAPEKPAPKPEPDKTIPKEPKALREELERTKADIKAKESSLAGLQLKIAELESKGKDTTVLAERLAQKEKELEEAHAELRAAKAEVSPDFKDKWDKPFNNAAEYTKRIVEGMQVGEWTVDEATGHRIWTAKRAATWEDFAGLYQMPASKAAAAARAMFGEDWQLVIQQMTRLQELDYNRQQALTEEKAGWKEKETAKQAEAVKQREAYESAMTKTRESLLQSHAEWYADDPNDPEGNAILAEARRLVMEKPKTFQQAVILATRNRLNAESAPRERYRNQKLREENEALKAQIEEMKSKKPGPGTRTSSGGAPETEPDELEELKSIKFS